MMIGWLLIGFLTFLLAYLLVAPFHLRFDSREAVISVNLFHLGIGQICYRDESLWLKIRVLGIRFEWDAIVLAAKMAVREERKSLEKKQKYEVPEQPNQEAIKKPRKGSKKKVSLKRIRAVLRSFRIPECVVQLDTGTPHRNGMLFPMAWWLGKWSGRSIGINFQGRNVFVIEVENSLGRMLLAYLRGK